jgi:hypothetical protein
VSEGEGQHLLPFIQNEIYTAPTDPSNLQGCTLLIRKRTPLGLYSRPRPRALRYSSGGCIFLCAMYLCKDTHGNDAKKD